jgi:molybdopterin/thiamine biosynthesis adenylyltransferase
LDTLTLNSPVSLVIDEARFAKLRQHLFPGDGDEHGAVLAAGLAQSERGTRLLVREVFLAEDGLDYLPGWNSHRILTGPFIAQKSDYCARERLCYLAVHCHSASDTVGFSPIDLASHEHGYPALLDITCYPVGALVFGTNSVAGDIWTPAGRYALNHATIVGRRVEHLYPSLNGRPKVADLIYDRQMLLFGAAGQQILAGLKIGVIGLGGVGSLLNEWLARLGVGHIVAVDFERIDLTNLPRVVGAYRWEALAIHPGIDSHPLVEELRRRLAAFKVTVARRVALQANPQTRFEGVIGDVIDEDVALQLADADFIFLASDSMRSRLVFNALVHQYLIPGIQMGAKVPPGVGGEVGDVFAVVRPVLPHNGGGCLDCNELIPPHRLRQENLSERERRAQQYVADDQVRAPSVITLNALAASQAINDFLMMFTGLYADSADMNYRFGWVRERKWESAAPRYREACLDCGCKSTSRRARGDGTRLPCRLVSPS